MASISHVIELAQTTQSIGHGATLRGTQNVFARSTRWNRVLARRRVHPAGQLSPLDSIAKTALRVSARNCGVTPSAA
jgi:hypothetical protein